MKSSSQSFDSAGDVLPLLSTITKSYQTCLIYIGSKNISIFSIFSLVS